MKVICGWRNVRPEQVFLDAPVHEEQFAPILVHHRLAGRPVPRSQPIYVSNVAHIYQAILT